MLGKQASLDFLRSDGSVVVGSLNLDFRVKGILDSLEAVRSDASVESDGVPYVEVLDRESQIWIGANKFGLLQIAAEFLRLAQRGVAGAHSHLDETTIVDVADRNVVIRLIEAPWSGEGMHCSATEI